MNGTTAPPHFDETLGALEQRQYQARPLCDVLDDVVSHNRRFIHHSDESTHWLVALWVAHTHGLDKWDYTGRLYIHAPQPGVGKSMQAKVMQRLCPNDYRTVGVSAPGLFRAIDDGRPTVFLDEADNQFKETGGRDKADVTAVINGGYERGNHVVRSVNGVARWYHTYAAMCVVGIDNGTLPEATRTRCIPVAMVPKPAGSTLEKFRPRLHEDWQDEIRWQLSNAALDWAVADCPFDNRQGDLWESLCAVAASAGGTWPERAAVAAERHLWRSDVPEGKRLLRSIKDWFDANPQHAKVQSAVLAAHVSSYDDLPSMQGKGVAQRLKGYGLEPRKRSESWYHRADLEPVWRQWL